MYLKWQHIFTVVNIYTSISIDIYTVYIYISTYIHIYAAVSNGKWKTEAQAIFFSPFAVRPYVYNEKTDVIRLQTD
jgi:hypothetical protein